jgi:hypothetical protein
MKSRFRLLAALLALLAFSATMAEGLWASTCASMDGMGAREIDAGVLHSGHSAPSGHLQAQPPTDHRPTPDPGCPLMPVIGACAALFSPATTVAVSFAVTIRGSDLAAPDPVPDLLLVSSLLRPPRA